MKIKIITDSTSYLDKNYIEDENIRVVPLNYVFDGEDYKEGLKGEFNDFYSKLQSTDLFPTTSQPAIGDFVAAYEEALKSHDQIVVITLSSKISGTYTSAHVAAEMVDSENIRVVDSLGAAATLRFLVQDAVEMSRKGMDAHRIQEELERKKDKLGIVLTTDTLEYLSRGGRLSSLQAGIGNILSIKPVIRMLDGELQLVEKTRGKKKAINRLLACIPEGVDRISLCHVTNTGEAEKLADTLRQTYPGASVTIDELGPVIGAHLGPKTLGICYSYS
jgi:DegV family protein with EDD domain